MTPIIIALVFIFGLTLPAFLLYEPQQTDEAMSWKLALIIAVAVSGIAAALFRIAASWWRTRRLLDEWRRNAVPIELPSHPITAYKLRHRFPVFAVVGIFRPRLFIAEQVFETLEETEIAAVTQHELGHIAAFDNLKRLALRLCGDILVAPVGRSLERAWSKAAENAADEYAVRTGGGATTALNLASALIKIARIIPNEPEPAMPAVSYAFERGHSLAERVKRLLALADQDVIPARPRRTIFAPATGLLLAIVAILASDHRALSHVHEVSEFVLGMLQ